ncbi:MAG TPA: TonB family protein [Nitrospiraceae bacterium]|nr:TonB family protein [Nitrospiraceae bacterium]
MTAAEWDPAGSGRRSHQAGGWVLSVCVHALAVGCAFKGLVEIPIPGASEPFRWEVAMVQPQITPPVEEPPPVQPPEPPKASPPVPPTPRPRQQAVETPRHTVQPQQHRPLVTSSVQETRERVERTVQADQARETTPISTEREMNQRTAVVEQEAATSFSETLVAQVEPVARSPVEVQPEAVSAPVQQMVEAEAVAEVQDAPAPVNRTKVEQAEFYEEARFVEHTGPQHSQPVVQQVAVREQAPAAIEQRIVKERPLRAFPKAQADYGWLSDTLWKRIEQLKRYPALARSNHWEGKVIVEAVIQDDGAIIDTQIAESSGHAVLDQQALTVLKQASPLTLKHPLGQRRVTILVPISYRLDG